MNVYAENLQSLSWRNIANIHHTVITDLVLQYLKIPDGLYLITLYISVANLPVLCLKQGITEAVMVRKAIYILILYAVDGMRSNHYKLLFQI